MFALHSSPRSASKMKIFLLTLVSALTGAVAGGSVAWPGAVPLSFRAYSAAVLPAQTKTIAYSSAQYINGLPSSYSFGYQPPFTYQPSLSSAFSPVPSYQAYQPIVTSPSQYFPPPSIFYPHVASIASTIPAIPAAAAIPAIPALPASPSIPNPFPHIPEQGQISSSQPTPAGDEDTAVIDSAEFPQQQQQQQQEGQEQEQQQQQQHQESPQISTLDFSAQSDMSSQSQFTQQSDYSSQSQIPFQSGFAAQSQLPSQSDSTPQSQNPSQSDITSQSQISSQSDSFTQSQFPSQSDFSSQSQSTVGGTYPNFPPSPPVSQEADSTPSQADQPGFPQFLQLPQLPQLPQFPQFPSFPSNPGFIKPTTPPSLASADSGKGFNDEDTISVESL